MPDWLSWDFWAKDSQSLNHLALIIAGVIGIPLLAIRTFAANRSANASLEQAKAANQSAAAALEQAKTALEQAKTAAARHEEQTKADREQRITESMATAGEQLGSDKLEARLIAIYTLERISKEKESAREYWPIMETLTAFVRERAPWQPRQVLTNPFVELQGSTAESTCTEPPESEAAPARVKVRPATDIQAVLTVLGRRDEIARQQDEAARRQLDLAATDLRGAYLLEAHLEGANLKGAHLEGANLMNARLDRAYLPEAHLDRADLRMAHLKAAILRDAHLDGTKLATAHLDRAYLDGAVGLTRKQLDWAFGDAKTKVADKLRPAHWPAATPEQPDNAG